MVKERPVRVTLLGPPRSGKTVMLATVADAVRERGHGYPFEMNLELEAVEDGLADLSVAERISARLEKGYATKHERLKNRLKYYQHKEEGIDQTALDAKLDEYLFQLSFTQPFHRGSEMRQFVICDAAGEHIFPMSRLQEGEKYQATEIRNEVAEQLSNSEGLVIVIPIGQLVDSRVQNLLSALVKDLKKAEWGGKRIVIALNKYDLLFTGLAGDAWTFAADPLVAEQIIRQLVGAHQGLRRLAVYDQEQGGPFEIAFIPTSSFGFLPRFGCPNVSPDISRLNSHDDPDPEPFPSGDAGPLETWDGHYNFHPFLTADPFIYAGTGLENPFIFRVCQVFNIPPLQRLPPEKDEIQPPGAQPSQGAGAKSGGRRNSSAQILKALKRFFNDLSQG